MIRNMVFHISVVLLITGCGKDEEGIENRSPNGILIEVEAPQTNGWSTEEVTGTLQPREPPPAGQTWTTT